MFPDGRPTHLLGELSYNSDAESEGLSKNNPRHSREPRVPRPVVPWVEYDIVRGWQAVEKTLHEFAMHCDHCPLVGRSGHVSKSGITYRMECGYSNRIGCPWQCRVFIYFDQQHAAALYHRKHPNAPAVTTEPPDTTCYDRQTMFVVPQDMRNVTHSNHVCVICTAYVHANHNGFCKNGAHCMWEAFCALNPYALNFKRSEIQKWLVDRQINCTHIDPHTGEQTNQLGVMVNKCKRYAERLLRANTLADGIRNNYEGKLLAMCEQYDFKETAKRMGHAHFTAHTPYILPGWSADNDDTHAAGGYCILVTTMNLALNLARAHHWFAGKVTMALDHTFKVIPSIFVCHCPLFALCNRPYVVSQMDSHGHPHICINVIAPDQSAHRCLWNTMPHGLSV
jgi:hypothetical protein